MCCPVASQWWELSKGQEVSSRESPEQRDRGFYGQSIFMNINGFVVPDRRAASSVATDFRPSSTEQLSFNDTADMSHLTNKRTLFLGVDQS